MTLADELLAAGMATLTGVDGVSATVRLAAASGDQTVIGNFVRGEASQRGERMQREDEARGRFSCAVAGLDGVDAVAFNEDTVVIDGATWTITRELERSAGHVDWEVMIQTVDLVRREGRVSEGLR